MLQSDTLIHSVRQPINFPNDVLNPHKMLFHLIVQNFINQLLTRQFIGDLAATRKSKLTYNHLKSSHLSRFVYVGKKSLNVRLREEEVIFILQATALKDTIKLM